MITNTDEHLASEDQESAVDPDPISLILEIANLIIQPGSLALIAAGATAVLQYKSHKQMTEGQRSKIRGKLYEIDRALNDGFGALMTLASLLDQFNYLERHLRIGEAPIRGYKNAQKLRRAHEDCRAAVKDARDAFIELSELLPAEHSEHIGKALDKLNRLYQPLVSLETPYGRSLVAATFSLNVVDDLICKIGKHYDFERSARSFTDELIQSIPLLRGHNENMRQQKLLE
jgi:hypothetical protein